MATLFTSIVRANGESIRFYSADRPDINGNRRIIVHFLDFLNLEDTTPQSTFEDTFNLATRRAKRAGFRRFKSKEFGGGFICQYDFCLCRDIAERIINAIEQVG